MTVDSAIQSGRLLEQDRFVQFPGRQGRRVSRWLAFSNGALYGVTATTRRTEGTAFQLVPPAVAGGAWTKTTLHIFHGGKDGSYPTGLLVFDSNGALYGVTRAVR